MTPIHQIIEDAVAIRGIVDYLFESPDLVTTRELARTQHLSDDIARRLTTKLEAAGIIHHPTVPRTVLGVTQPVPQLGWTLTEVFRKDGEAFPTAEELAREVRR